MKKLYKYVITFIIIVFLATISLNIVGNLPNNKVRENINNSEEAFRLNEKYDFFNNLSAKSYGIRHIYADAMMANIIFYLNKDLKSVIEAKYYTHDTNLDFNLKKLSIDNSPNNQYLRYWHGYILIYKPMLMFFKIDQIYVLDAILLFVLTIYFMVFLYKEKLKEVLLAFLIGFIMCFELIVPFCLEYTLIYVLMILSSMLVIKLDKKYTSILFFITGMLTCFFDFLTNDIVTLFVPFILYFVKNNINNLKDALKLLIKFSFIWFIGYISMFLVKWIIASVILNINIIDLWNNYIKNELFLRIGGNERYLSSTPLFISAIQRNFISLFPFNDFKFLAYLIPLIFIVFIKKGNWKTLFLLIIALSPYIRYMILPNHSYWHSIFTFRTQIISIMAISLAIYYCIDWKKIKWKKN